MEEDGGYGGERRYEMEEKKGGKEGRKYWDRNMIEMWEMENKGSKIEILWIGEN